MKYLRNSDEIKETLLSLYSGSEEKWAVVAFVGGNALSHLPLGITNLHIICWPKAGGTNPDGVRDLIDAGIDVSFCQRLHDKIYFTKGRGIIVGSPNLSENALGDGGLHEFAVYIDDGSFNIEDHISSIGEVRRVTADALAKLDIEDALFRRRNSQEGRSGREPKSFDIAKASKYPKRWKIVTWNGLRDNNDFIKNEVESVFGVTTWNNDNDVEPNLYQVGEYVLQVKTDDNDIIERTNAKWLFVDHIIKRKKTHTIVQVQKLENPEMQPFQIDSVFKKRFKTAFNASSWQDIINDDNSVRSEFIEKI